MSNLATQAATARKQVLYSLNQLGGGDVQRPSNFQDCRKRRAVFAPFEEAYIFRMISAFECEGLLCDATLLAQGNQDTGEGPLFDSTTIMTAYGGHSNQNRGLVQLIMPQTIVSVGTCTAPMARRADSERR